MPLIRSRSRCRLNQRAGCGPELRVVVAGADLEFLQRIDIRVNHSDSKNGALVLRAVKKKTVCRKELAIDIRLNALLRVLGSGMLPRVQVRPGNDEKQIGYVPVENRELLNLAARKSCCNFRTVGSEQRRHICDLHARLDIRGTQFYVDRSCRVDLNRGVRRESTESGALDFHLVVTCKQVRLREIAIAAALNVIDRSAVKICDGDRCIRHRSASGILNGS